MHSWLPALVAAVVVTSVHCSLPGDGPPPAAVPIQGPAGLLHVDDGGSGGMPVVFVHSFAGDSRHWSAQLAHLRPHRRAVAIDLRAHGGSAAPKAGDYAVASFASDIEAAVNALGLDRFILVGHSLGGSAALEYAAANPERVAGLLLVAAPGKIPEARARQILQSIESDYDRVMAHYWDQLLADARPAVREQVESGMDSLSRSVSFNIVRALLLHDPRPALALYTGPRLSVITAEGDDPTALHRLVPGLPHRQIRGTSHWVQMDDPGAFNAILDEFLAAIA